MGLATSIKTNEALPVDEALDYIMETFDSMFYAGQFDLVNTALLELLDAQLRDEVAIGILGGAFCAKDKLDNYLMFVESVRKRLRTTMPDKRVTNLLKGFEGRMSDIGA